LGSRGLWEKCIDDAIERVNLDKLRAKLVWQADQGQNYSSPVAYDLWKIFTRLGSCGCSESAGTRYNSMTAPKPWREALRQTAASHAWMLPMRYVKVIRHGSILLLGWVLFGSGYAWALPGDPPTSDMVTDEPIIAPTHSSHQLMLGKTRLNYVATFAETPLRDAQGKVQATISATSYVLEHPHERSARPVMFLFNGGPGASSSPLHFAAFGPKHYRTDAAGSRSLVDNPNTLLDLADLVFIDPVGTGFSRERRGGTSGLFWTPLADADAALSLIRGWLHDNHREGSPLYIVGESYGGFRIALMMAHAADLPISGLVLVSPLLDASGTATAEGNDQPVVLELPTLAVAAWEHHKTDRVETDVEAVYNDARRFAQSDYVVALQQGAALDQVTRERVTARVSKLIGLPTEYVAKANLRIDSEDFLAQLLADQSLEVGRLDTRVTAPKAPPLNPDRPAAANDPSLGLGKTNVIKSELIKNYMRNELNVQTERDYLSLSLDVNFRFKWSELGEPQDSHQQHSFYINPTPNIATVMKKRPKLRVLLVGGYYDLAVPLLAPRYALEHAGVPLDRVSMIALAAGHSVFNDEPLQKTGSELVRQFVKAGK
jgi:carboxypeptidase C (cathepsin A)